MGRRRVAALVVVIVVPFALLGCTPPGRRPPPAPSVPGPTASTVPVDAELAARAVQTATTLRDGSVLVAGGCVLDGCGRATRSTIRLGPDGATAGPGLSTARDSHTATLLDGGSVLVSGGFSAEGEPPLASAELFDPTTGVWRSAAPMTLGRGGHAGARLGDGRVIEVGGWVGPQRYTATTEIFDPVDGRFQPGPVLPVAAEGIAAVSLADGSVLVTGGQTDPGRATSTAVVIGRDGAQLRPVGPMGQARFKHTMVALSSGRVLVIGGTSDDRERLATTEIYDPGTHRFTPGPTMSGGRYKLSGSATLLPDGRVLVAGGGPGVEVIDPGRGISRRVPAAGSARASFSTVSVLGDAVRVVGGYDEAIRLTRTDLTIPLAQLP